MKSLIGILVSMVILLGLLTGCGSTPEPTPPPADTAPVPTQPPQDTAPPPAGAGTPTEPPPTTSATEPSPTDAPSPEVEPTEESSPTPAPPQATWTSPPPESKYPPPALLAPTDGVRISWGYTVLLEWSSVGELAEDEYYHLHLDAVREVTGEPWYGDYVYTKDTSYRVEGAFLAPFHPPQAQGDAVVSWWVRVVRKTGEDENGKPLGVDLSAPSEKRTFVAEPKPE